MKTTPIPTGGNMSRPVAKKRPPKPLLVVLRLLSAMIVAAGALCYIPLADGTLPLSVLYGVIPALMAVNALPFFLYLFAVPGVKCKRQRQFVSGLTRHQLRVCGHGLEMLHIFLWSTAMSILVHLIRLPMLWQGEWQAWLCSAGVAVLVEAVVFLNGILCVYICSTQLGVKWRLLGLLFGLIPIAQLFILRGMMLIVRDEIEEEAARIARNEARASEAVCTTKYPILLVHGVFFRDFKRLNYWGRIPEELEINGATVYYGNQPSAVSVRDSAKILAERIREIVRETGCEKVNVIAHSKGGLDMRAALAFEDIAPFVATVTTINTPHRGCKFADFLLGTASEEFRRTVADTYNTAARIAGDPAPDLLAAVGDLTAEACACLNDETAGDAAHTEGILCRSVHSRLDCATSGQFPLNFTYLIAKWFDGPNDGLVSDDSAAWGESHLMLTASGKRGISHGDMIDLNRQNIPGFDVREFYVQWVADLKERGF